MTIITIFWYTDLTKLIVFKNSIINVIQLKKQLFLKEVGYFFKNAPFYADEGDLKSCAGLFWKHLIKREWLEG